jgi:hypothetical protein
MELQFPVAFVPKFRCHIGDFEMLTRPAFKPVENCFDRG